MINFPDRPDADLDRYLDDAMSPEERRAFDLRLATDADLRAAVDMQRAIDVALRRQFTPPEAAALAQRLPALGPAAAAPRRLRLPRRPLALAAALLMLLTGGLLLGRALRGPAGSAPVTPLAFYDATAPSLTPQIVCRDEREFTAWFQYQFAVPLRLDAEPPDGVEVLGLSYAHTLTPDTIQLLARVQGRPVVVFIDRGDVTWSSNPVARDGLFVHRGRAGALELIEVSPLDRPSLLPLLTLPEARP